MKIGTLIYGAGKSVFRSFKDFDLCVEPHMNDKSNTIYYFGDMDYEGILIYEKFAEAFKKDGVIVPFCIAYEKMLELAQGIGIEDKHEEGKYEVIKDCSRCSNSRCIRRICDC